MALDLLKRSEKGTPLTEAEHDANFTAIEDEVNGKAPTSHTHTESDITDLSHDAEALLGVALDSAVGSPSDGNILVFRSAGSDWVLEAKPATLNAGLDDIDDVAITTPADDELLAFDNASGDWINKTAAEAGLATASHQHALDDLSDVSAVSPDNNDLLAWDTGTGAWLPQTLAEVGAQALLSTAGVTVRGAAGALNFSGGTDGQIWTVQGDGSVAFEDISAHTHDLSDITDAGTLAGLDTVGTAQLEDASVTAAKFEDQAGVTPGQYTNATVTVSQEGIITAVSSGSGGSGLSTSVDSNTALTVGAATGTHKILDAATAITLTLSDTATVGTRQAFTPGGAGAVSVQMTGAAGYWLPLDNTAGSARTASFGLTGYGYFEVFRNSGGSAAEWVFFGESDHTDEADNPLDMNGEQITNAVMPLADDEETASFTLALTHGQQKMVRCNHASTLIDITIPADASVDFPDGTMLHFVRWGAAAVTFDDTNVTLNSAGALTTPSIANQYGVATLWKQTTNVWVVFGDIEEAA